MDRESRFRGCLVGGAIGDALGWPVEFLKLNKIVEKYGEDGYRNLEHEKSHVTDDTQMTLFTGEGILRAETRGRTKGICDVSHMIYNSYQRWLHTQGEPEREDEKLYSGWLINVQELYERRAPGNTCLASLKSGKKGSVQNRINNSKGCGGVMRVAPIGLFYEKNRAFDEAIKAAALTHGHPSGFYSAGVLAYIISAVTEGIEIHEAVKESIEKLCEYREHEETRDALLKALSLFKAGVESSEAISEIGEGWVGEEALAIAVFLSLKYQNDFKQALICAVNHDGDSDSTGAITGNILGAFLGYAMIPVDWIEKIEMKREIIQMADDLNIRFREGSEWWNRYPGY